MSRSAPSMSRYSVYLLYYYKITNTDACGRCVEMMDAVRLEAPCFTGTKVRALLVQKYCTRTDC